MSANVSADEANPDTSQSNDNYTADQNPTTYPSVGAKWPTNMPSRVNSAVEIMAAIGQLDMSDESYFDRCRELLDCCTQNVALLQSPNQSQDMFDRRHLFQRAEYALQQIYTAAIQRLDLFDSIGLLPVVDIGSIEKAIALLKVPNISSQMGEAQHHRSRRMEDVMRNIYALDGSGSTVFDLGVALVSLAAGERVTVNDGQSSPLSLPQMRNDEILEENAWKKAMHERVVFALVLMAKSLSMLYGGQSVQLCDARLPVTCFARA